MVNRPKKDTLESLRVTLQQLEQTADPARDAESIAQLKRILVNRIAELELLDTLTADDIKAIDVTELPKLAAPDSFEKTLSSEDGQESAHSDPVLIEKRD